MKLMIVPLKGLRGYVSRQQYFIFRELIDHYGWKQMDLYEEVWNNRLALSEQFIRRFDRLPEVILFWEGYAMLSARRSEIEKLPCRKCIIVKDLHAHDFAGRIQKKQALSICDSVLSTYLYPMESLQPETWRAGKVVWVPHGASPDFLQAFNPRAENAVLLSGAMSHHYPLRHQMKQLSEQKQYAITCAPHPGYGRYYDYERDNRVGAGFARLIHRHRSAFTDASIYRYVLAKYFEIPATGALLLAERSVSEELHSLGFVENQHYIGISRQDLDAKVRFVLDPRHHEALNSIRAKAQALVWERHKTSDRARLINDVCTR